MSDKYGVSQDPDCYPNSSVLVNKLNIRDAQELEAVEAELTQLRSESFGAGFAAFDLGALAAIHRHLFFGNAIKLCRTQKGFTQAQLSENAKISTSYLSLLEQGKRDPNLSTIQNIATALDVPISILMFLATDKDELNSIPDDLAEKLSFTVLKN